MENKFVILILNYNNANLTINLVQNLKKINQKLQILVVDNCSTDNSKIDLQNSLDNVENVWLLFNEENLGYANGNNKGFEYIDNNLKNVKYVFIMNPDIEIIDNNVFFKMVDVLAKNDKLAVITALTIYNNKIRFPNDAAWKMVSKKYLMFSGTILAKLFRISSRYTELKLEDNIAYVDIVQGCFFGIKMDVAKEIGFFDKNTFLYGEEIILAKKIKKYGYKEAILVDEFIKHNHKEKNKKLIVKENKIFDMSCFYNSRKYIIDNYSDGSVLYKFFAKLYLNIDFNIKKILINFKLKK